MTQKTQAPIVASTLRTIDAGGFINTQLDKAAALLVSQDAQILALKEELTAEKRYQRTRDAAAVRTLSALGYDWHGGDSWQAAPKAVGKTEKEQIQALMDKHQIWIQQTTYEEHDRPPYDLFAIQAEQHQFEAFVQDLIALYSIQPAGQSLITELEHIAYKYAMSLRDAACTTYAEDTERLARNAKSAFTVALQGLLCKQPKPTLNRIGAAAEAMSEVMAHIDLGARSIKFERALAGLRAVLACDATQPAAQGLDARDETEAAITVSYKGAVKSCAINTEQMYASSAPTFYAGDRVASCLREIDAAIAAQAKQGGA